MAGAGVSGGGEGAAARRQVVVVGSGFGGALAAWPLVEAGLDVLMLERGAHFARGPHNWEGEGSILRTPVYSDGPAYVAHGPRGERTVRGYACVGGPSVFYGGVSLRFRERDFAADPEIVTDSGARWPYGYAELAPYYARAERILMVAGRTGEDPTEPPREGPYPQELPPLSAVSARVAEAARGLGLHPFRLPLAINYGGDPERRPCVECATCDTFACAIEAKNDLEVHVLRRLRARGLDLRPQTVVTGLHVERGRVAGVTCRDRRTGETWTVAADHVVLAGGALATAQLLLASGLAEHNPAGELVGRYLTRHCSGIVFGAYAGLVRHEGRYHKQIGIHDFYDGDAGGGAPPGPLGNIQQTQTPHPGTVEGELPAPVVALLTPLVRRLTGLLVIAEDRPRPENGVRVDPDDLDEYGLPRLHIEHRYTDRDLAARRHLARRAREVHRAAGARAWYTHTIDTFSHALGTVRMGDDAARAPLDGLGRFRGVDGLWVADGSALPTSAGVNPSLTIAAHALRVGEALREAVRRDGPHHREGA
ncbi:MAG: GMC family oxidoreductase [Gemmatimonadetes bacterium]|nr:MAG: GMC family oxidoreductase [Gemmatimonadota bacterium]